MFRIILALLGFLQMIGDDESSRRYRGQYNESWSRRNGRTTGKSYHGKRSSRPYFYDCPEDPLEDGEDHFCDR